MTSDSSDSPLVLTPDSTGTGGLQGDSSPDSCAVSVTAAKRARRQTAFYPNMNASNKPQKPFSRSAAKRESVMALGSIEHLQYFFTKTGLAAKKKPLDKAHLGLVPAIGGKGHVPSTPSITSITEFAPRPPAIPEPPKPLFSPHIKNYEVDPESLLPGVIEDLVTVTKAWKLEKNKCDQVSQDLSVPFDVLEVLKTTTRAIRSTRNYLLSLPDDSADALRAQVPYRPRMFGPRVREPSLMGAATASSQKEPSAPDSVARIRRSALEVLTVLRHLEEFYRLPLEDDAYDAHSDGEHSRIIGPSLDDTLDLSIDDDRTTNRSDYDPDMSISFSIVQVQGQYKSIPVWEDDDDDSSLEREERTQKKDGWEERLVLGTGWLYQQDVKLSDLQTERAVVASYLDIVDEVLFHGKPPGETSANEERGWQRVQKQREWKASLRGTRSRRVSAPGGAGSNLRLDTSVADSGKRRASAVHLMGGMRLTDEPEEMEHIHEDETDEELNDDHLPEWAKRSTFADDRLGRAHALLAHLLPPSFKHLLGRHDSRNDFLQSLASGQLLCVAYNTCVRKSKQPWGFVNKDGIHDILALERAAVINGEEGVAKKVWTFRRIDNLRLWVGALKLRYMLPIQTPSQPLSNRQSPSITATPAASPSAMFQTFPRVGPPREPPILFDAKVVAKKEDGWEDMLENVLFSWMERAVTERRIHH